jgi:RNA polymerase sigma-70 factor (ECF subfamily)
MLLQHSRASARYDKEGNAVLLEDQDRSLWKKAPMQEGLALIEKAMRSRRPGPYQIQAAIAGVHAHAATASETDWSEIEVLYQALERHTPSPVVTLNRSVALSKTQGAEAALSLIQPLADRLDGYFYFHGVRGSYLKELGRTKEAREAFNRAIALANTPAEAAHIRQHLDSLTKSE